MIKFTMTKLNYILQGFGLRDFKDLLHSSFGHTFSMLFFKIDVIMLLISATIHFLFGFNHFFDCFCNFINIRIDKRVWQPRIVGKENTKVVK